MGSVRLSLVASSLWLLAGCATPPAACGSAETAAIRDSLYFGTAMPGGVVTPQQWSEFLATSVTPRFPQGLTAWPASGQWRGADGQVLREASHVLELVHPDDAASEQAVQEIVAGYKARFRQEAVLRVKTSACMSF